MYGYEEHCDFVYATDTDWDRAEASEKGSANPEQAWILTSRDVWHANPYYHGPAVPHPESDIPEEYGNVEDWMYSDIDF